MFVLSLIFLLSGHALAAPAKYTAQALNEAPPDALSEAVRGTLAQTGVRVLDAGGKPVFEFWFCNNVAMKAGFKPSSTVKYPFAVGQLVGAIRVAEDGTPDFRENVLQGGVFTLRYGQQPQDGNHLGTSKFQDFLVLVPAGADADPATIAMEDLQNRSKASTAEGTHPGVLSLQPADPKREQSPAVTKKGAWWILGTELTGKAGDQAAKLKLDVVVEGHAEV
jgi:hypothetical protein